MLLGLPLEPGHQNRRVSGSLWFGALGELEVLGHGFAHRSLMREVLPKTPVIIAILSSIALALKIIIARCTFGISPSLAPVLDDLIDPPVFSGAGWIDCAQVIFSDMRDASSDVISLSLKHVCQVKLKRRLVASHDK